jgi:hypothetical protein
MRVYGLLILACITLNACATNPKKQKDGDIPRILNLAPNFLEYWDTVKTKPVNEQLIVLKSDFFPRFQEFYDYKVEKWKMAGKSPDDELAKVLKEFPQIEADFRKKNDEINNSLSSALDTFSEFLPDLNKNFDVYVTHSLGEMDGGTRKIGDKMYLILGIDGMVKHHKGFESEMPFFHHEFFHFYHGQFFPEEQVLWIALWNEGLATYASQKLNPDASIKDLILDIPVGMISRIDNQLDFHWHDLNKKLESKSDADYEAYFLMSSKDKKIVPRSGYYLGYLIAMELGKSRSVPEMARLKHAEILPLMKTAISKLRADKAKGYFKR